MTFKKTKAKSENKPLVIVLGLDENKKPKAARFPVDQLALATEAAKSLGLQIHEAVTPELSTLAKQLPAGRIYARGKAFLPFVKRALFDQVNDALGRPVAAGMEASAEPEGPPLPRSWDELTPGHVVLVDAGPEEGWWASVIVERNADVLTLRWRGFPKLKPFQEHIAKVALVNPGPLELSQA